MRMSVAMRPRVCARCCATMAIKAWPIRPDPRHSTRETAIDWNQVIFKGTHIKGNLRPRDVELYKNGLV